MGGYSGISISEGRVYAMFCDDKYDYIACLNSDNGREIWRAPLDSVYLDQHGNGNGPRSTPVVDADAVSLHELWKDNRVLNSYATAIVHGEFLYGFNNKFLSCIDLNSGEGKWKQRGFSYGTLIYADGHLAVLGEKGNLALVEATPNEYAEVASAQILGERCYTLPSLSEGKLYLRNETSIVCLDLKIRN